MEPKILPCSHIFCKECLITLTSGTCPEAGCTKVFTETMSKDKKSRESFVNGLPNDLVTKALAEMAQLLQKTNLCSCCCKQEAKSFCLDCFYFLCPSCFTVHNSLPSIAGVHKVEKLETLTPELLVEKRPVYCSVHPDRPAELFCLEDGKFLCKACEISDSHSNVMRTRERIKELLEELKKKSEKTSAEKQKLHDVRGKLAQGLQALDEQSEVVVSDIDQRYDQLEKALKDSRRLLKERALSDVSKAKGHVQAAIGRCLDVRKLFEAKQFSLERVRKSFPTAFLNEIMDMLTSDDQEPYDVVGFSAEIEDVVPTLSTLNLAAIKTVETAIKDLDLKVNQVNPSVMVKKAAGDDDLNENRTVQTPRLETMPQKQEVALNQATTPSHEKRAVSVLDPGKGQFSTTSAASTTRAVKAAGDPSLNENRPVQIPKLETMPQKRELALNQATTPSQEKKAVSVLDPGKGQFSTTSAASTTRAVVPRLETTPQKRELALNQATTPSHEKTAVSVLGSGRGQVPTSTVVSTTRAVSTVWRFHTNHGSDVILSIGRLTAARRLPGNENGIVVASQPMEKNKLYQVKVDMIAEDVDWWFTCGVLMCESADQFALPATMYSGGMNAVVFNKGVSVNKTLMACPSVKRSHVKRSLYRLKEGDVVGFALDDSNGLHLKVNGQEVVGIKVVSQSCFVFIELDQRYKQVTTLPV